MAKPPTPARTSVELTDHADVGAALKKLGLKKTRPVVVLVGWAGSEIHSDLLDPLRLFFDKVVVPACSDHGAAIVTGGTDVGVMREVAAAVKRAGVDVPLVGVAPNKCLAPSKGQAPSGKAPREPHHLMLTTPGDKFTDEGRYLVDAAERLSGDFGLLLIAVGGGEGTRREVALAAEREWPTLLVTTSHLGGVSLGGPPAASDALAASPLVPQLPDSVTSPSSADVNADVISRNAVRGNIVSCPINHRLVMARACHWILCNDALLKAAWSQYAELDHSAVARKARATRLAKSVVAMAVATVALTMLASNSDGRWAMALKALATVVALCAAGFVGVMERRRRSGPWIELRTSAEATLQEIYRYRARMGCSKKLGKAPLVLAQSLSVIDVNLRGRRGGSRVDDSSSTWAPKALLNPEAKSPDLLVSPLRSTVYDKARVANQLRYYQEQGERAEQRLMRGAALLFAVAGFTALMTSMSWYGLNRSSVAWYLSTGFLTSLSTIGATVVAAGIAWRSYLQHEPISEAYFSTCVSLRTAQARWNSQAHMGGSNPEALLAYVEDAEAAFAAEGTTWNRSLTQAQRAFLEQQSIP